MPENDAVEFLKAVRVRVQDVPQLRSRCPDQDAGKNRPVTPTRHSVGCLGPWRNENALLHRALWCVREGADAERPRGAAAMVSGAVGNCVYAFLCVADSVRVGGECRQEDDVCTWFAILIMAPNMLFLQKESLVRSWSHASQEVWVAKAEDKLILTPTCTVHEPDQ